MDSSDRQPDRESSQETVSTSDGTSKKRERITAKVGLDLAECGTSQSAPKDMTNDPTKGQGSTEKTNVMGTPSSSPPNKKMTSIKDMIDASNAAKNLTLAHEIALDNGFKLPEKNAATVDEVNLPPLERLEKRVREQANRAFWELLKQDFKSDPVVYDHAFVLLAEIKENFYSLLPDRITSIHKRINEGLDIEFLKQQADNDSLDIRSVATFVIDTIASLCAPVRDNDVAALRSVEDVVEMFQGVYKMLGVMKRDLVNHTISSVRPLIQQQHVEYERKMFAEVLSKLPNGLEATEKWLDNCYNDLKSDLETNANKQSNTTNSSALPSLSPLLVLKRAYVKLLDWDKDKPYPETLLADQGRFAQIQDEFKRLVLVASLCLTTFSTFGPNLSTHQSFVASLKQDLFVLVTPEQFKDLPDALNAVAEQIWHKVIEYFKSNSISSQVDMSDDKKAVLKSQIEKLSGLESNPVYQILVKRSREYLITVTEYFAQHKASTSHSLNLPPPPGLQIVFNELTTIAKAYSNLVNLNQTVYGPFYAPVLRKIMDLPATPSSTPTTSPRDATGPSKQREELSKVKKKLNMDSVPQGEN